MKRSTSLKKPTLLEKTCFGIGDFANNGIFTFVSTYLMYYYTDSLGLSLGMVSSVLLIGRAVDAACSPIMGIVVDRTETRFGKCRPFLMIGTLPVCAVMTMIFSIPYSLGETTKVFLCISLYVIFSIFFSFVNVPYSTLINVLTNDNEDRIVFNAFKTIGANLGGVFVTSLTLLMVDYFSKNGKNGFSITAMIFGIIFLLGTILCVINVRERVHVAKGDVIGVKGVVDAILKNKPWMILCGVQFLALTYMMVRNQGTIYYMKYYLNNEGLSSILLVTMPIASVVTSLFLPSLSKKYGMKACVIVGNCLWCIAMAGMWALGKSVVIVVAFQIVASFGWGIATGMVFVMLAQTIDYGKEKTGFELQGILTSLLAFMQKLGVAASGVICAQVLKVGGYVANQNATESSSFAIRTLFCGLPLLLSLMAILLISRYRLNENGNL
ncbi:MAG: MFS transporter [Suipraeoptans sp.]